jgi:hypothetical protein
MDIKKLLMGGIVAAILYFGLGYLVYGKLLTDFMHTHPGKITIDRPMAQEDFMYLIIGNLLGGFLIAYIFLRANVRTAMAGLVMGGILGLLMSASFDCIIYGTTYAISRMGMAADVAASTVMSAITGAIVAMVMGAGNKTA